MMLYEPAKSWQIKQTFKKKENLAVEPKKKERKACSFFLHQQGAVVNKKHLTAFPSKSILLVNKGFSKWLQQN